MLNEKTKGSKPAPPHCPNCAQTMRLGRKTRRFNGLPDLYIFKCQKCDMSHTAEGTAPSENEPGAKLAPGISTNLVTHPRNQKTRLAAGAATTMNAMQKQCVIQSDELHTKSVLIVEDDKRLMRCLTLAIVARGFEVIKSNRCSTR